MKWFAYEIITKDMREIRAVNSSGKCLLNLLSHDLNTIKGKFAACHTGYVEARDNFEAWRAVVAGKWVQKHPLGGPRDGGLWYGVEVVHTQGALWEVNRKQKKVKRFATLQRNRLGDKITQVLFGTVTAPDCVLALEAVKKGNWASKEPVA